MLKITRPDAAFFADEVDGWDELIDKHRCQWGSVLGDGYQVIHTINHYGWSTVIVKDEQDHILELRVNAEDRIFSITVYNPVFTIEG